MKRMMVVALLVWASTLAGEESDHVLASCSITNNVLTCGAMGITFPLPEQWFVAPEGPVPVKLFQGGYRLLIADKHVGLAFRNRMIIVASDSASAESNYTVEKFVSRMAQTLIKQQDGELIKDSAIAKYGSLEFYRAEFKTTESGVQLYKSVVATEANGFQLAWVFVAGSREELNKSIEALERLVITKIPRPAMPQQQNAHTAALPRAPNSPAPSAGGIRPLRVRVSQGVSENMLIHKVQPVYPPLAREKGIEGLVVLKAVIGTDGAIKELSLGSGDPALAESALSAVRQWRYKPYFLNGSPVEVDTKITVKYFMGLKQNSQPASPTGN